MRLIIKKNEKLNKLIYFIIASAILFNSNHLKSVQSNDDLTYLYLL